MQLLRAVIAGLVTLIAALLLPSASASAAPTVAGLTRGYAYDAHCHAAQATDTASERGPPLAAEQYTTNDAVDYRAHDSSARAEVAPSYVYTSYGRPTHLAHIDTGTGTTLRQDEVVLGELSALQHSGVAAYTGTKVLRPSSLADEVANATGGPPG